MGLLWAQGRPPTHPRQIPGSVSQVHTRTEPSSEPTSSSWLCGRTPKPTMAHSFTAPLEDCRRRTAWKLLPKGVWSWRTPTWWPEWQMICPAIVWRSPTGCEYCHLCRRPGGRPAISQLPALGAGEAKRKSHNLTAPSWPAVTARRPSAAVSAVTSPPSWIRHRHTTAPLRVSSSDRVPEADAASTEAGEGPGARRVTVEEELAGPAGATDKEIAEAHEAFPRDASSSCTRPSGVPANRQWPPALPSPPAMQEKPGWWDADRLLTLGLTSIPSGEGEVGAEKWPPAGGAEEEEGGGTSRGHGTLFAVAMGTLNIGGERDRSGAIGGARIWSPLLPGWMERELATATVAAGSAAAARGPLTAVL
mmetsp:Transcript_32505/g.92162  ORF Transcript_32505/g.92162 Transcript_32505/m.92162 type:complete len:363 (+) Transcript_32505:185-1273(+)